MRAHEYLTENLYNIHQQTFIQLVPETRNCSVVGQAVFIKHQNTLNTYTLYLNWASCSHSSVAKVHDCEYFT